MQYNRQTRGLQIFGKRYDVLNNVAYIMTNYKVFTPEMRFHVCYICRDMRFRTMWYVRPAKPQISLRIRAV